MTVTASPCSFSWHNYTSGPKSAPNSDSFWVRRLFNVCLRVFCAPTTTILLVYIPAKIKMSFIWKDDFFFLPKSGKVMSQYFPSLLKCIKKDKTNYLSNQTWAKSVTIHVISTCWKKETLDDRPYIIRFNAAYNVWFIWFFKIFIFVVYNV